MARKRMSEDAKMVIEASREGLESTARQALEFMDESQNTSLEDRASDETADSDDSHPQSAQATSSKDARAGNPAIKFESAPDKSADADAGGQAERTGSAGFHGAQRVKASGRVRNKQPRIEKEEQTEARSKAEL